MHAGDTLNRQPHPRLDAKDVTASQEDHGDRPGVVAQGDLQRRRTSPRLDPNGVDPTSHPDTGSMGNIGDVGDVGRERRIRQG